MKKIIYSDNIFGMSNLAPRRTGLNNIDIWFDHKGNIRHPSHEGPSVKLESNSESISISISLHPKKILAPKNIGKKQTTKLLRIFKPGIEYVSRNWDLFMKNYMDSDGSYDDDGMKEALRARGEYK